MGTVLTAKVNRACMSSLTGFELDVMRALIDGDKVNLCHGPQPAMSVWSVE